MSYYVAFEGGEGSGKSTQARRLAERVGAVLTYEPGATPLGAELRALLLDVGRAEISARAEALLMAADRAHHFETVVGPALAGGRAVVSDRSLYSSLAYQGGGRGLGVDAIGDISRWALAGRLPDLVVLLDIDPVQAYQRLARRLDRFEREDPSFHERVRATYRYLADADPQRWVVLDATAPIDALSEEIGALVERRWP